MLSDDEKMRTRNGNKNRSLKAKGTAWSDKQKQDAIIAYITFGSTAKASAATGIPEITIKLWRGSEWGKELERELRAGQKLVLSERLRKIVDKSLDVVADRLEKGNFVYDQKSGQLIRKPVDVRDAAKIASEFIDKQEQLESKEAYTVAQESIAEKLDKLKQEFIQIVQKQKTPVVTDVIEVNADSGSN